MMVCERATPLVLIWIITLASLSQSVGADADIFEMAEIPTRGRVVAAHFADFDGVGTAPVSRNSVSHGVTKTDELNLKSSTLAILILDQIFYHLPKIENEKR